MLRALILIEAQILIEIFNRLHILHTLKYNTHTSKKQKHFWITLLSFQNLLHPFLKHKLIGKREIRSHLPYYLTGLQRKDLKQSHGLLCSKFKFGSHLCFGISTVKYTWLILRVISVIKMFEWTGFEVLTGFGNVYISFWWFKVSFC